jgi:transposase
MAKALEEQQGLSDCGNPRDRPRTMPASILSPAPTAGLTGSPDESGARRREQGLARAGNARVRRGMIQLAWRFLMFQKESALALWYRAVGDAE